VSHMSHATNGTDATNVTNHRAAKQLTGRSRVRLNLRPA
jgi:hypothetical protein